MNPLVVDARKAFHSSLLKATLSISPEGIPSNADKGNKLSIRVAQELAKQLKTEESVKLAGQTSGANFEESIRAFLEATFPFMDNLRPGLWTIEKLGNRSKTKTSSFAQYRHLGEINDLIKNNDALEMLLMLIEGNRLKDISDLPLDLCV